MTRWDALTSICSYLRGGLLGGEHEPQREIIWELMIEVASFHFVTPALARCLGADPTIPPEVRNYFEAAAVLNGKRNEAMVSGLARIAALLNAIDIEPILLKGAAHVVEGTYPDPALRILGDIDILIPASRAIDAMTAMQAGGFATKATDVMLPPTHHHLPMLHEEETGVGVELHTDVIDRSPDHAISTAWFCETTKPISFRNQRVSLPEPTRNCAHTIFHSELFHEHARRNKIHLRHLLDLALMRARHESAIDWGEVDHRFSAAGHGEVLATYLDFAHELFGQPAPKLSDAPRRDAMAKLREMESRNSFQVQIEHLKGVYERLQTSLSGMTVLRDHFQSEAERLERARGELTVSRDHFRSEAERRERALARIMSSRSWRLTGPLRTVSDALRRWLR
jgi:hypothetical protein